MAVQAARRGAVAANRRKAGGGGGGGAADVDLKAHWDAGNIIPTGRVAADQEMGSAHQMTLLNAASGRTRLGSGNSLRFEMHDNPATDTDGNMRSLLGIYDTNEGGVAWGSTPAGPSECYWAGSSYLPTSGAGDPNATVTPGFPQTGPPQYQHLFEIHDRNEIINPPGAHFLDEVPVHALMVRLSQGDIYPIQLQYRGRCGTFNWNGSSFDKPNWNYSLPGDHSGSYDVIGIPITKPGSTDADMITDAWVDWIFGVKFRTDSTGFVKIWARQAGQVFTSDSSPNFSITGPTIKTVTGDGPTRSTADPAAITGMTGSYVEFGLYNGDTAWNDPSTPAHVHILDVARRYSTVAAAKANWG